MQSKDAPQLRNSYPITVAIAKSLDMKFINYRILVPMFSII